MLVLNERDVRDLLSMDDLIAAMQEALAELAAGRVAQPLRTVLEVGAAARVLRPDAGVDAQARRARRQAGHGVPRQPREGAAVTPRDHPAARLTRPASCWPSWTAATSPRRAPRRCRRSRRNCWRAKMPASSAIFGSGVQARSHLARFRPRPIAARGPRLEPDAVTSRGDGSRDARPDGGDGHGRWRTARRSGRRRHDRARHGVSRPRHRGRLDRGRDAHRRSRRLSP